MWSLGSAIRKLIGGTLLGLGGWSLYSTYLSPSASYAILARERVLLRAPIAGKLTRVSASPRAAASAGQVLAVVEDQTVDASNLTRLAEQTDSLRAETEAMERLLGEMRDLVGTARSNDSSARRLHENHLRELVSQAQAERTSAEEAAQRTQQELTRAQALAKDGLQSEQQLADAALATKQATSNLERTTSRVRDLDGMLKNAQSFGAYDTVAGAGLLYNRGRADDLRLAIHVREGELGVKKTVLGRLEGELRDEQQRIARLRRAELVPEKAARLWNIAAREGEYVNRGDKVLELVSCSTAYVVAVVLQRYADDAMPGMRATFEEQSQDREYQGTVVQTLASEPPDMVPRIPGVGPGLSPTGDPVHFVLIELDKSPDLAHSCGAGLVGEVEFHHPR